MKIALIKTGLAIGAAALIVGCGGSDNTTPTNNDDTNIKANLGTGYYLDSAVVGVDYVCGSEHNKTGEGGKFTFEKGKECKFSLAGIPLRTVNSDELEDGKKIIEDNLKVARFLQSIDADGNTTNGILINDKVLDALNEALENLEEDDKKPEDVLNDEDALKEVVGAVGDNVDGVSGDVVSEEDAQKHIDETKVKVADEENKEEMEDAKKGHIEKDGGIFGSIKEYFEEQKREEIEDQLSQYEDEVDAYGEIIDQFIIEDEKDYTSKIISKKVACESGSAEVKYDTEKHTGTAIITDCQEGRLIANGVIDFEFVEDQNGTDVNDTHQSTYLNKVKLETSGEITLKTTDGKQSITLNGLSVDYVKKSNGYTLYEKLIGGSSDKYAFKAENNGLNYMYVSLKSAEATIFGETLELKNISIVHDEQDSYHYFKGISDTDRNESLTVTGLYNLNDNGWIAVSTPTTLEVKYKNHQISSANGSLNISGDHNLTYTIKDKGKVDVSYDGKIYNEYENLEDMLQAMNLSFVFDDYIEGGDQNDDYYDSYYKEYAEYYDNGYLKLKHWEYYNDDGQVIYFDEYSYNENGEAVQRKSGNIVYWEEGVAFEVTTEEYTYTNGLKTKVTVKVSRDGVDIPEESRIVTYEYNDEDKVSKEIITYSDYKEICEYTYNDDGSRVSDCQYEDLNESK